MITPTPRADRSSERSLRFWSKSLGAWSVCDNAACRRAQACRGDVRACWPKNSARLPAGVQDWFRALMIAKQEGFTFDEAIACIDDLGLSPTFAEWYAALPDRSAGATR